MTSPRLLPCGDSAFSVDFGNVIDLEVNGRVHQLDQALTQAAIPGVIETVPTYHALMIHFDPLRTDLALLEVEILRLSEQFQMANPAPRVWDVPVVYDGADLLAVAEHTTLSPDEVVQAHTSPVYTVMMIGFMPGFSYLGGLDPRLQMPRRDTPRKRIPGSSISIGGAQTAIGTVPGPSGWHLLGHTPVLPFKPDRMPVFLFEAGDRIHFRPISSTEGDRLSIEAEANATIACLNS